MPEQRGSNYREFPGEALPTREQLDGLLLFLSGWFPGFDHIFLSLSTKRSDSLLFGDFGAFFEDNRYQLGICFFTILNGNGFEALEAAERRTDVSFTTPSNNAGHPGDIGHITSHRRGGESDDGHRHRYNSFFHFDRWQAKTTRSVILIRFKPTFVTIRCAFTCSHPCRFLFHDTRIVFFRG